MLLKPLKYSYLVLCICITVIVFIFLFYTEEHEESLVFQDCTIMIKIYCKLDAKHLKIISPDCYNSNSFGKVHTSLLRIPT